jgi:hypothetical protein
MEELNAGVGKSSNDTTDIRKEMSSFTNNIQIGVVTKVSTSVQ